jgi:hypothetical protein
MSTVNETASKDQALNSENAIQCYNAGIMTPTQLSSHDTATAKALVSDDALFCFQEIRYNDIKDLGPKKIQVLVSHGAAVCHEEEYKSFDDLKNLSAEDINNLTSENARKEYEAKKVAITRQASSSSNLSNEATKSEPSTVAISTSTADKSPGESGVADDKWVKVDKPTVDMIVNKTLTEKIKEAVLLKVTALRNSVMSAFENIKNTFFHKDKSDDIQSTPYVSGHKQHNRSSTNER